ncbi:MAG: PIN domain-containing protein [Salinivenus sp.]
MNDTRYGLDTGFFFRLFEGAERARGVWTALTEGSDEGVVSSMSVYELQRNALKGLLVREDVEAFLAELPYLCTVHETLSVDTAQRAAHLGWGNGLAMADALILQAFLEEDVTHIVTTDRDFEAYEGEPTVEVI